MEIELAVVTDYIGKTETQIIPAVLKELSKEVYFSNDSGTINKLVENSGVEIILGSGLENQVGKLLNIPNYIISYPAYGKTIIHKSDIGYSGAIHILEDLSDIIINNII